ncbi:MAG: hypothetical protein R3E86_19880 [Pseudomonadales bacterium]
MAPLTLGLVGGCSGAAVEVPQEFPIPLVEKLPLRMGLLLTPELTSYVHEQTLEGSGDWRIELGSAQTPMFRNLLAGMFESSEIATTAGAPGLAGVLEPAIEEVQFSTPDQTRSDYYEVWIRYRFQLFGRDGTLVADWPLAAYGKANQRHYGMSSREPALQAAALAACRDAMAFFTVQFRSVPDVQRWLAAELAGGSE